VCIVALLYGDGMKKGWLNNKDGYDASARGKRNSQKATALAVPAPPIGQAKPLQSTVPSELRRHAEVQIEKGAFETAAEYFATALAKAVVDGQEVPKAALAVHAGALLRANCVDDAFRAIVVGSKGCAASQNPDEESSWMALKRRCETTMQQAATVVQGVSSNSGTPPIPGLLQLLRLGIEDLPLWDTLEKVASPFFRDIGESLKNSAHLDLECGGLLLDTEREPPPIRKGTVELVLFRDASWQGGRHVVLPRNRGFAGAATRASEALGLGTSSEAMRLWAGAALADGLAAAGGSGGAVPWACVRHGDWVRMDTGPEDLLPLASAPPGEAAWPELRCSRGLVAGALQRADMERALGHVSRQRAIMVPGAHLLPMAENNWSLEYLEARVPSGTAESSLFTVYRAKEPYRNFRYVNEGTTSSVYDIAGEQLAEQLLMSFSDFARKKRACAAGEGDGWAYYLWVVALRRTASSDYEGYNLGQEVDTDLVEGLDWGALNRFQEAGGWGELLQSQIFIGCKNALTPCHMDCVHNVYTQVRGWKRFLLFDPGYNECLYRYPTGHPLDRSARVDLERPDFARFPRLHGARAVEAVLGPGDALVIPAGWFHHVQTLTEDSISVASWFLDDPRRRRAATGVGPLDSFDHLLLGREAEQLLEKVLGTRRVRGALGQLRGMLGGEAPKPEPEEVLPCCFILWRLVRMVHPGGVRRFVRGLAEDERFAQLRLKK